MLSLWIWMKHSTTLPQTSSTMADPNTNPSADKRKGHGPTVNALKRAKFEAKQERRRQQALQIHQHPQYASWFNGREEYAAFITAEDVHAIRKLRGGTDSDATASISTRLKRIAEWIEPFFDLKEMPSNNTMRDGEERLFISEGTEAVRMMIQRCDTNAPTQPSDDGATISAASISHDKCSTEATSTSSPPPVCLVSILSKPATFFDAPTQLLKDIEKRNFANPVSQEDEKSDNDKEIPPFKIIIANEEALSEIAGFPIARGALACGIVPSYMRNHAYEWLRNLLSSETSSSTATQETQSTTQQQVQHTKLLPRRRKLLALDRIANAANMGSILRTAAAFSIDAIILSDDSCDAWYRQSVRVSLGHVVTVPIIRVSDWKRGHEKDLVNDNKNNETSSSSSSNDANNGGLGRVLDWLRDEMNVESLAAVVDDEIDKGFPPLVTLESYQLCNDHSWICVLGNEGHGISDEVVRKCDKRITIQSSEFVDSLSLPVAAGILMHVLVNARPKRKSMHRNVE